MEDERIAAGAAAAFSCQLMVLCVIKKNKNRYCIMYIVYYCTLYYIYYIIVLLYYI